MVALVNISHLLLYISAMEAAADVLSSSVTTVKKYRMKKFESLGNLKSHLLESLKNFGVRKLCVNKTGWSTARARLRDI